MKHIFRRTKETKVSSLHLLEGLGGVRIIGPIHNCFHISLFHRSALVLLVLLVLLLPLLLMLLLLLLLLLMLRMLLLVLLVLLLDRA